MEPLIVYIIRALSFASGMLLCYGSFFLYDDEEKKVQNILEDLWIRIDDLKRTAVFRHTAITRTAAESAGKVLDRIFGKKLISLRAVAVAGCLSVTSLYFFAVLMNSSVKHPIGYITPHTTPLAFIIIYVCRLCHTAAAGFSKVVIPQNVSFVYIGCASAMLAVILSALIKRLYWLPLVVFTTFVTIHFYFSVITTFFLPCPHFVSNFGLNFIGQPTVIFFFVSVGVACDIAAIALTRILLRLQADWTSLRRTLAAALVQLLMAIALIVLPIAIGLLIMTIFRWNPLHPRVSLTIFPISFAFMLSSSTNLLSSIVALAFFVAASILLIHRLLWPFITRPMYRLALGGVFRTPAARTAFFSFGVALILFGMGKNEGLWLRIFSIMRAN